MENQLNNYFCKNCGRTEYIDEREWVSKSRCYECRKVKTRDIRNNELDRKHWGVVCEMHKQDIPNSQIAFKFNVYLHVIQFILTKYYGCDETRVLMTFKPDDEDVIGRKWNERSKLKYYVNPLWT